MGKWPKDNQAALIRFYGDPGKKGSVELVRVTPPFQMYYDRKPLKSLSFHKKAAPALRAALDQIWEYYNHDQATIDELGISRTAGTYNPRKIRGSKTKWSNHAYGAAIDINAEENGFNMPGNIPRPVIAAFKAQGFKWGGDYRGRKDPMHFELVDSGEPHRTFEGWLSHYKVRKPVVTDISAQAHHQADGVPYRPGVVYIEVRSVQQTLSDLGYSDVGMIDGKWGGRTKGAISAFKNDRGLDGPAVIDDALRAEMQAATEEGWSRPIAEERATATVQEIAETVPEAKAADDTQKVAAAGGIFATIAAFFSGLKEYISDAVEYVSPLKTLIIDIPGWFWAAAVAGLSIFVFVKARRGKNASLSAYQDGRRS